MAKKKAILAYADTSVFGGVFDPEFAHASLAFFELIRAGKFRLILSPQLDDEISRAPAPVQELYRAISMLAEAAEVKEAAFNLQQEYLDEGILPPRWDTDALHVAYATVSGCRLIISWNFRHIVNFRKIELYNAVNVRLGYPSIAIHSPREVIEDEEEI
jgi:hypothetical protein